jgi:DNA-binding PadR family transcriptional regulator
MSAKHALLGLLLHRPAYPYELADRLQQRLGPAWAVNSGQLYQTIGRLEEDSLIERVDDTRGSRDDRHVFAITQNGIAEFERWFEATANGVRLSRRPLLVKITFAGAERLEHALEKIDAYERDCAARLTEIFSVREAVAVDEPLVRADHVLLRLNLSADIFQLEAELRWTRHAREMVSWLLARQAVWPSARERANLADGQQADQGARKELFARMAAAVDEDRAPERNGRADGGGSR